MISLGAGLALGAGISAFGGALTTWLNNRSVQRENEIMREREDTAISRRMRDLEASGLSPTLAAGSPASAQAGTPSNYNNLQGAFDFASKYMSLLQGKSEINHTNAQAELSKMQATSELFHQGVMASQKQGMDLKNAWIDADMSSLLGLRKEETNEVRKKIGQITANTALLNAQTAYQQANTDYTKTLRDNALINQDMLMIDRQWRQSEIGSKIWSNYTSGNMLKTILGSGGSLGSMLTDSLRSIKNGVDNSDKWYYPLKVK